jgi:hypothetical protein
MSGRGFGEEGKRELTSLPWSQAGAIAIATAGQSQIFEAAASNMRTQSRRRTRLQAAKLLDCANAFLVEALIRDRSAGGICLLLARNVGLPMRFGVHDDATGEIVTVATAWRRGQTLGVRILGRGTAGPLKRSDRVALGGRYYGIRD